MDDQTLYNQITVKNIDNEDFVFKVDRQQYMIKAGEVRVFPKFMVRPMLKHLIDRILIKRDPEGKLLRNQQMRDELASRIVLNEESYQRPTVPSDHELVEHMNQQPELDRILAKNKSSLKKDETPLIDPPAVDTSKIKVATPKKSTTKVKEIVETTSKPVDQPVSVSETFDQLEDEKNQTPADVVIPAREKMMSYAKNVLKMDLEEPKTKKAWDAMSDEKLFVELGLDKEEDLESLGF